MIEIIAHKTATLSVPPLPLGCYGTLGLESGGVADAQLSASSAWEWHGVWAASSARLRKAGLPWAPAHSDQQQWLQVDLKRKQKITGSENTRMYAQVCTSVGVYWPFSWRTGIPLLLLKRRRHVYYII